MARIAEVLGFVLDRQRGSHAIYYRSSDRRRVVIPMHSGTDVITDLGITPEHFAELH